MGKWPWALGPVLCTLLLGCGPNVEEAMPLEIGRTWNYSVRSGFLRQFVEPVKVVRRVSVAGTDGYELVGPLGVSRLVWKDRVLRAQSTVNARFSPPVPLLAPDRESALAWRGTVEVMGRVEKAEGSLLQETQRLEVGGRKVSSTLSTLTLRLPGRTLELRSWFAPGIGLVKQEQRTGNQLDLALEWMGGS